MEETKKPVSRQGISPKANMENIMRAKEEEDLKYLYRFPKGFNREDGEEVVMFFNRMEALRVRRETLRCEENKRQEEERKTAKQPSKTTNAVAEELPKETANVPKETPEEKAKRIKEEKAQEEERKKILQELENKAWNRKECALAIGVSEAMLSKYVTGKVKRLSRERLEAICDYFSVTPHYLFGLSSGYDNVLEIDQFGQVAYRDGKPCELVRAMIVSPIVPQDAVKRYEMLYKEHPAMFWNIQRIICAPEAKRKKVEIILEQLANL